MILVVCVDKDYGMGFNHRRQSSDRMVTQEILNISAGKKLWITPYSASLFPENAELIADKYYLEKAGENDVCFAESVDITPWIHKVSKLILFHWNRKYPADIRFPSEAIAQWELTEEKEFSGYTHDKITMEVYSR